MASAILPNPMDGQARATFALTINMAAAEGLLDVMRTSLGPTGSLKILVSGAGDIKITKYGNVLLHEMQIQDPISSLIAMAGTAQNNTIGDGTTSTILLICELLSQAEIFLVEGLHPFVISLAYDKACVIALKVLDNIKIPFKVNKRNLSAVADTSLRTKVHPSIVHVLTDTCVNAVLTMHKNDCRFDLSMVELVEMQHNMDTVTKLIRGLVLDQSPCHSEMPTKLKRAYILTCNVLLECKLSERELELFCKTAQQRELFILGERAFIDRLITTIIDLKRRLCDDTEKSFVVINLLAIDLISLNALAKEGIMAFRHAKYRTVQRLALACGSSIISTLDDLNKSDLGYAGVVYEYALGEHKYTFFERCRNPQPVTILVKGPDKQTIVQIKDAIRDGLRAISNAIEDKCIIPGAGAFEIRAYNKLMTYKNSIRGKLSLGIQAFAEALLVIPKTLAINSGYNVQETIAKLTEEDRRNQKAIGIDLTTGEPINPIDLGIYDNYSVKKQIISSCSVMANNLLLLEVLMRAGAKVK